MVSESDTLPERGKFSENFGKSTVFSTLNRCKTPLIGLQTSFFVNQHVLQQSKVLCSLVCHAKNSVLGVLKWRRQEFCDFMITLGTRILRVGPKFPGNIVFFKRTNMLKSEKIEN